jgi:penicillin-binding protein 1B
LYCNEVYLGQRSGVGVRGVAQAAKVFFGKELKDLSLTEAATIAGMLQSPARYAPDRHPDAARERRGQVLAAMVRNGIIKSDEGQAAQAAPVSVAAFSSDGNQVAPYYLDAVNRVLDSSSSDSEALNEQVLRVQTTIDPDLQAAAEQALLQQLDALSKRFRRDATLPQGALVALDPRTGYVLAMVGGRNYAESQLNRATDAQRQPGSVFKPFVYSAALESGISPLSTYNDAPQTFQYGKATYSPDNYGKSYSMHDVVMRDGLIRSLNVVTVELAMRTGLDRVANTAVRFGLPRPTSYPAMALGTTEVTPLQVAAAYAAFVNGGRIVKPTLVAGVSEDAQDLTNVSPATTQVIRPTTAYMITDMLADVMQRGTGSRAGASFKNVAIAGKTGTSRDGWFVGYTPNLVCAVWIGYDDNKQLGLTGAEAALPAWIAFMKEALALRPSLGGATFSRPAGIVTVRIDPETGFLSGPDCPSSEMVQVASQFAPVAECYKHRPELTDVPGEESEAELITSDSEDEATLKDESADSQTPEMVNDEAHAVFTSTTATRGLNLQTSKELNKRNRPVLVTDLKTPQQKLSESNKE